MLYNSHIFVFVFLPVSLIGYYLTVRIKKREYAKLWLILLSLWFYGSFQAVYLPVLLGSLLFNGIFLCLLRRVEHKRNRRYALTAGILGNLGVLFWLKYMNFFLENCSVLFHTEFSPLKVFLPLGVSFFTFQQISFLVDNYRGETQDYSALDYVLYIAYFPKLVEGPIVLHSELLTQLRSLAGKRFDGESFLRGVVLFTLGLGKKVLLADTFGAAVDYGYANLSLMHASDALLLIVFYSLQLYFDFSGYCNMARGISRMFGIELPVNFNSPYKARNIVDFWKRWHITLNRFFTKYLYIPLGGNRKGKGKMYRNLLLVFLVSGLWHGAGWNFILWGMLHGVLYVLTRALMGRKRSAEKTDAPAEKTCAPAVKIRTVFCVAATFLFVSLAWVFFRSDSVTQAAGLFRIVTGREFVRVNRTLAGFFNLDEFWYVLKVFHLDAWEYGHYILMAGFTVFSLLLVFFGKNAQELAERVKPKAWTAVLTAGLLFWCVLSFSGVGTFLYFNF